MMTIRPGDRIMFTCIRCDICCGTGPNVSITVFDLIRISKRINVHPQAVLQLLMNVVIGDIFPYITLGGDSWGRCVFLGFNENKETYCRIYDSRPFKCRIYPAQIKKLDTSFGVDGKCPGLGVGDYTELLPEDVSVGLDELREHYKIIYKYIIEEGLSPIDALFKAIEIIYQKIKVK